MKTSKGSLDSVHWITIFLTILVVYIHYFLIFTYSGNYFWFDDLIVTFHETERLLNADSFIKAFEVLVAPYADHRSMLSRVFFFATSVFNDYEINFQYIMLLGNLFSMPTFYIFWKVWSKNKWDKLTLVPIALIIFNLQYFEAQFFANGVFCYLGVTFFCIWLIYETAFHSRLWLMSIIGVLGLLTFGSMLFALIASVLVLFLGKDFKKTLFWVGITAVIFSLYFFKLDNPYSSKVDIGSINFISGFTLLFRHLASLFYFEGINGNKTLLGIGLLLIAFAIYSFWKPAKRFLTEKSFQPDVTTKFLVGTLTFSLLSAAAICFLRSTESPNTIYFTRYRFAPMIFSISVYFLFLMQVEKVMWVRVSVFFVFLMIYLPGQRIYIQKAKEHYLGFTANAWALNKFRDVNASFINPYDLSRKRNLLYNPHSKMDSIFESFSNTDETIAEYPSIFNNQVNGIIYITLEAETSNTDAFLVLKSDMEKTYWSIFSKQRKANREVFKTQELFSKTRIARLTTNQYPEGIYTVFYVVNDHGTLKKHILTKNLEL
jgi:hypothetical protein